VLLHDSPPLTESMKNAVTALPNIPVLCNRCYGRLFLHHDARLDSADRPGWPPRPGYRPVLQAGDSRRTQDGFRPVACWRTIPRSYPRMSWLTTGPGTRPAATRSSWKKPIAVEKSAGMLASISKWFRISAGRTWPWFGRDREERFLGWCQGGAVSCIERPWRSCRAGLGEDRSFQYRIRREKAGLNCHFGRHPGECPSVGCRFGRPQTRRRKTAAVSSHNSIYIVTD